MAISKSPIVRERSRRSHPENRGFLPPRTGVLGTILTELQFDEEARGALADLSIWIEDRIDELSEILSQRGRSVVHAVEGFGGADPLAAGQAPRPSILRLRKRVAQQWLRTTLRGEFDNYFAKQLRDSWMPILLSDPVEGRPAPVLIGSFFDWVEGYLTAQLMADCADNFVPQVRRAWVLRLVFGIQRRLLGVA